MTAESPTTTGADVGSSADEHTLPIGTDGETVPAQQVATGRGFITGKSGAGKSNSVTVLLEELFELGLPALVVDTDGEYHPLKERYSVLHVGAGAECDTIVDETDADRLAELAIGDGVPIILDVSEYAEGTAADVIEDVTRALFANAKRERRPYLLVVEEIQEYLPQRGSDALSELLTTVAKRGRKHGLGILGASQRPSSVDKDFITQSNWTVWHRLTYETDTKNAGKNLGSGYTEPITELDDGEAFLQADWADGTRTLRFRRKHVSDAGATPSIDAYVETPTAHDTDEIVDRFTADDESDESGGECDCDCRCSDRDVDEQTAGYERRAAAHLSERVRELSDELDDTEQTLQCVRASLSRQSSRVSELELLLEQDSDVYKHRAEASIDASEHAQAVGEIVAEHFGIGMGELYEEYSERVPRPNSKRSVRNYLKELRDAGRVVFGGKKRGRVYYPAPDGFELPDHVTPADAAAAVATAETLHELQQELRLSRKVTKALVSSYENADVDGTDGRALRAETFEYSET